MRQYFGLVGLVFLTTFGLSQPSGNDCLQSIELCPNIAYSASNIGATVDVCPGCSDGQTSTGNFCFEVNNTVWFSFTTNALGGNATVNITGISCLVGAGNDDALQAVVIDASTPCDESTYSAVSNCEIGQSATIILNTATLAPLTKYYIMIDGDINGSVNAAECSFDINVSGGAVDFIPNVTTFPEDCSLGNGQVNVTGYSGGQAPYTYVLDNGIPQNIGNFNGLTAGAYPLTVTDANGCVFNLGDQQVMQSGGPNSGVPITLNATCAASDGEIEITGVIGGTPPYMYALNGGIPQTGNTFSGIQAGIYQILVTDVNGCFQEINNVIVSSAGGPTGATVSLTDATCGVNDGEIMLTVSGGTPPYMYALNGAIPQMSNNFIGLGAGIYSILITDALGCTFLVENIQLNDLNGTLAAAVDLDVTPNPSCVGDPITVSAAPLNGGSNPVYTFFINGVNVQTGTNANYTGVINNGDDVYCVLTSNDVCAVDNQSLSNTASVQIFPNETPSVSISVPSTIICPNEMVTITANETACQTTAIYEWFVNGISVASGSDPFLNIANLLNGAVVTCEATCNTPCSSSTLSNSITFTILDISADAGDNQQIILGGSTILNGTSSSGNISWSPSNTLSAEDISNPVASPTSTTTYVLTVTENGCTAIDSVIVFVSLPIVLPNTFTPNGDGTNDTWQISRIESYPGCDISIYDRWGQRVYRAIGYSNANAWDGTYRGGFLPAATYYYVIDLKTGDTERDLVNGSITIVY